MNSMNGAITDLHYLDLTALAVRIEAHEVGPVEITRAQLERIASVDGVLGSYVAAQLGEPVLIRAGVDFQRVTSWHRRHPGV
jgi:amidase